MERTMTQRLLAEFVGSFTLIFIGAGAVIAANASGGAGAGVITIALAHGFAIATMVSAVGHVSGGHFNPAITIAAWVTQKIGAMAALVYIVAQLAGAAAGAGVLRYALPGALWNNPGVALGTPQVAATLIGNGQGVLIEAVVTFFLVWVVFATAIDPEGSFGKIAGLAIGLTVAMGMMVAIPFTGGAINPARAFGPAVVGGFWNGWWVYWIGPVAGAIVAASLYDTLIIQPRVGFGDASEGEQPHGWGAHGDDADATRGAVEGEASGYATTVVDDDTDV